MANEDKNEVTVIVPVDSPEMDAKVSEFIKAIQAEVEAGRNKAAPAYARGFSKHTKIMF